MERTSLMIKQQVEIALKQSNRRSAHDMIDLSDIKPDFALVLAKEVKTMMQHFRTLVTEYVAVHNEYVKMKINEEKAKGKKPRLTDEEREQIQRVQQEEDDRKRALFEKQQEESRLKNERKAAAQSALAEWKTKRDSELQQIRSVNKAEAEQREREEANAKKINNSWTFVCNNIELDHNAYVGEHDVRRMRDVMLARRDDITKAGGMKKAM